MTKKAATKARSASSGQAPSTGSGQARSKRQGIREDTRNSAHVISDVVERLMPLYRLGEEDTPDCASGDIPSVQRVIDALHCLQDVLFPGRMSSELQTDGVHAPFIEERLGRAYRLLVTEIARALPFQWLGQYARTSGRGSEPTDTYQEAVRIVSELLSRLPEIRRRLVLDVEAAYTGDPAAMTFAEVMVSYPCIKAITTYRIAHELYLLDVPLVPRIMTEHAHSHTGIDIHPGAQIGESFFIDHGTGVVIGETTEIGNRVKIYQGVTLGAKSFPLDPQGNPIKGIKRHPTIEDDVIIYAGATILGGQTVIGQGSIIGASVWLLSSVPPYSTVVLKSPDIEIRNRDAEV